MFMELKSRPAEGFPFNARTLAIVPGETLRGSAALYADDEGQLHPIDITASVNATRLPPTRCAVVVAPGREDQLLGSSVETLLRRGEAHGSLCTLLRGQLPVYAPTLLDVLAGLCCDTERCGRWDRWIQSWLTGQGVDRVTHPALYSARIAADRSRIPERMLRAAACATAFSPTGAGGMLLHAHEPRAVAHLAQAG